MNLRDLIVVMTAGRGGTHLSRNPNSATICGIEVLDTGLGFWDIAEGCGIESVTCKVCREMVA